MAREIISGDAGTVWQNDTGKAKYQFHCAFINTCGFCLQYHLKISANWPIPLHFECKCGQTLISPGQKAPEPFCNYRELLDNMSDADKTAAIGASSYRLLKSGLATWEDIVTPNRVRDFREVVAKKKLTVKQMVDHGVKRYQAEKAYSAVHTEEHQHVERQRRELLAKLTGAGLSQDKLVEELGNRLAARVTIAPGPTGPAGPAWGGSHPWPHTADAAVLAKLISGWRPAKQKAAMPKAPAAQLPTAEKPKPTETAPAEYREFRTREEAEAWATRNYSKWEKSLTQAQRDAIEDYRHDAWKPLNDGLRSDGGEASLTPSQRAMAKSIDAALAKHPLPEGVVVNRTIDLQRAGITREQLVPGATIVDKAFVSTSINPQRGAQGGQRLEIRLPKGTPAAYVANVGEGNKAEAEILVSRKVTEFRVVGTRGNTIIIEAVWPPTEPKK